MSKITSIVLAMASALAKKHGLTLRIDPKARTCATNGKNIIIPPVAKILETQESVSNLETYLIGAIIHEVGHINFTDFDIIKNFRSKYNNELANFVGNVIEDVVIERAQINALAGGFLAISKLWKLLYAKRKDVTDSGNESVLQSEYIFHTARFSILKSGESETQMASIRYRLIEVMSLEWVALFDEILQEVNQIKTTAEGADLSRRILEYVKKDQDQDQDQDQEQEQEQDQSEEKPQDQDQDQEQEQEQEQDQSEAKPQDQDQGQDQGQNSEPLGIGSGDAFDLIAEDVNEILEDQDQSGDKHEMIPSEGSENSKPKSVIKGAACGRDMQQRILQSTMVSRERILDLLKSETSCSTRFGKTGKLVPARLWKLKAGNMNVFKKIEETHSHSLAVKILGDKSGSMSSDMQIALEAMCLLPLILDDVEGVKTSIDLFPYNGEKIDNFKHWEQRTQWAMQKLSMVYADGGTPLGTAMIESLMDLEEMEAERKMMIVITDGQPDNEMETKKAIKKMEEFGVEVIGVGINVNLGHLFTRWVSCRNVQELSIKLQNILEKDIRQKLAA